jgi:hypothetical protein
MKVGFFLHFDFTMNGMLFNELRCYNTLFNHPNIEKVYIFDYKGKYSHMLDEFDFEFTRVHVNGFADVEKFTKVDLLFTWDWYQDFFGGVISPKAVDLYKILSHITNEQDLKVYFRICDFKHEMRDYKKMIQDRINTTESGIKFVERNPKHLHSLDNVKMTNYDNVYFLCNGNREVCDWSWITLTKTMPFLEKENVQNRSCYISDDILFRYEECYENNSNLGIEEKKNLLYHVGNLNPGKVRKIKEIMKSSEVPLFLRTAERTINGSLRKISSIEMIEEPIVKDEMYKELNSYIAYLFVGKGEDSSYYFNKTLYDASIARTVFLIYGKIDSENIYRELSDYVFNDEKELKEKFEWIKENYQDHLDVQREVLQKNLSTETMEMFDNPVLRKNFILKDI